jgi:hypothetical protein
MTWAVPTQPPARPQTVTPGSTRGPTQKTVIARREHESHPLETGRSPTLYTAAHMRTTRTGRSEGPLCPPVPSLGAASPCEPLVFDLGNRSRNPPPIPAPKVRMKGYQPTVSTVGSHQTGPQPRASLSSPRVGDPWLLVAPCFSMGIRCIPGCNLKKHPPPARAKPCPKLPERKLAPPSGCFMAPTA